MVKPLRGGWACADLQDGAGRIQLFASRDVVGADLFDRFTELDPGDIVGARGPMFTTRRGEPTIEVGDFALLTKALRPLPDKWHGLKDVEIRYRQRYVDLIANPSVRDVFRTRTRIIEAIRRLYDDRGYLEVEPPVLQEIPGARPPRPSLTPHHAPDRDLF